MGCLQGRIMNGCRCHLVMPNTAATPPKNAKDHFRASGLAVTHADILMVIAGMLLEEFGTGHWLQCQCHGLPLLLRPASGLRRLPRPPSMQDPEGRSKGCGIVEFATPADALRSISMLSNSMLAGRQISVREDREDPALARGAGGGARGGVRNAVAGSSVSTVPPAAPGTQVKAGRNDGLPAAAIWLCWTLLIGPLCCSSEL